MFHPSRQTIVHRTAIATLAASLASVAFAQTTTMGTRSTPSQPNTTITGNANANWKTYSRSEQYPKVVTLPLQFITLKSGKKLTALVTVPADSKGKPVAGAFPAVLTQTAYRIDVGHLLGSIGLPGNTLIVGGQDPFFVKRGYVGIAVDTYGSGGSGGEAKLLGAEEQEAYAETVDWVSKQPWFNGQLGLAGTSYLGITALLTAQQQHPAVKAVFAQVPMGDAFRGTVGTGGMLNANFIKTWLVLTQSLSVQNDIAKLVNPQYADDLDGVTQEHIAAIDSWYLPTVEAGLNGTPGVATDDGDFWAIRSPIEKMPKVQVPTFIIGAHADIFQRDEPLLYEQIKHRVDTKLVILKGAHVQSVALGLVGNDNVLAAGAPSSPSLMLQWFDHYLKGMDTGVAKLPNVTQYVEGYGVLGSMRYSKATDWPHPAMKPQRFYLRGDMSISAQAPTSSEAKRTVSEPKAPEITYGKSDTGRTVQASIQINDGSDCSISHVQWTLGFEGLLPKACYLNNATVERTQKALVYETGWLKQDLYINGPIQADIWVSTTKSEAALSVRVDVVDFLGKVTPITGGLQSVAHRAVDTTRSRYVDGVMMQPFHPLTEAARLPVIPGQPTLVPVEVFPAAALIRKGQKLRIAISASNQAQGIWAKPQQAAADGNVSTILSDPSHPSSIVLPVVPASQLN